MDGKYNWLKNIAIIGGIGVLSLLTYSMSPRTNTSPSPNMYQQGAGTNTGQALNSLTGGIPNNITGSKQGANQIGNVPSQISPSTNQMTSDNQKAQNVNAQLSKMPELSQVATVVSGNNAIVGYTLKNNNVNAAVIKNSIITRIKEIDPALTNLYVEQSANTFNRVSKVSNDITNNKPATGINGEINALMKSIAPHR